MLRDTCRAAVSQSPKSKTRSEPACGDLPPIRQETSKEFAYGRDWNGTVYATKRVRPVFVEESTEIVVITVYTYFY